MTVRRFAAASTISKNSASINRCGSTHAETCRLSVINHAQISSPCIHLQLVVAQISPDIDAVAVLCALALSSVHIQTTCAVRGSNLQISRYIHACAGRQLRRLIALGPERVRSVDNKLQVSIRPKDAESLIRLRIFTRIAIECQHAVRKKRIIAGWLRCACCICIFRQIASFIQSDAIEPDRRRIFCHCTRT